MEYPSISEYKEAVQYADSFESEELRELKPVKVGGEPVMTSGNFAVVFKMQNEKTGELFALKCFTQDQNDRADAYRKIIVEGDGNVFACSDALAYYVIMMYEVACGNSMPETNDKNSDIIALAKTMKVNFKRDVINPLLKALQHNKLEQYCVDKYHQGLLALDDYSLARLV